MCASAGAGVRAYARGVVVPKDSAVVAMCCSERVPSSPVQEEDLDDKPELCLPALGPGGPLRVRVGNGYTAQPKWDLLTHS